MIFSAKEKITPTYYDDDKPKSIRKTAFGLIRIILFGLGGGNSIPAPYLSLKFL